MKNVYILDEHQSSKVNGLGVFVKELIRGLVDADINVCHIDINADEEDFAIQYTDQVKKLCFPKLPRDLFSDYTEVLNVFFRLHIQDSSDNIFILNHSPCEKMIKAIKQSHPLSKIIFIIHDFGWTSRLDGNYIEMDNIINNRDNAQMQEKYKRLYDYFDEEKRMYALVDKVVCLSKDSFNLLLTLYNVEPDKIQLIYNGLIDSFDLKTKEEKKYIRKKMYVSPKEKVLVYVGRINKIKGGVALLKAFINVLEKNPNCRLVVIGHLLESDELLKMICSISTKITFTGHISKNELEKWYRIADIGLIPSYIEQCSYSAMEMQMYGLPIIASDGFGVRCMFEDGINSKVARIEDRDKDDTYINNIFSAINELLSSHTLRRKLGNRARTTFLNRYEVSHMHNEYIRLLKKL